MYEVQVGTINPFQDPAVLSRVTSKYIIELILIIYDTVNIIEHCSTHVAPECVLDYNPDF